MNYNLDISAYSADLSEGLAERVVVEIGDAKDPVFFPQVKLMRAGNAANLSLRYICPEVLMHSEDNGVVTASVSGGECLEFFNKRSNFDFEMEVVLQERPKTNRFCFSVRSKGVLGWEKVRDLTSAEDLVGALIALGDSGSLFHIKRPLILDAAGGSVWGTLDIDGDILTVTVPEDFLASATLPIRVDPTIGYTNLIGLIESTAAANWPSFLRVTLTESAKDLIVLVYCSGNGVSAKGLIAAADGPGGKYGTLLGSSTAINLGATVGWVSFPVPGTLAAGTYWIGFVTSGSGSFRVRDASGQALLDATGAISNFYATPASPVPNPDEILSGYAYVMRLDYTINSGSIVTDITASADGISAVSGEPDRIDAADGSVSGVSSVSAEPARIDAADGSVSGVSAVSGEPDRIDEAAGSVSGVSAVSAAPTELADVPGAVYGVSSVSASPGEVADVTGAVAGVSAISAAPEQVEPTADNISAAVDGVSSVSASPSEVADVGAAVSGESYVSASGELISDVGAAIDGVSAVDLVEAEEFLELVAAEAYVSEWMVGEVEVSGWLEADEAIAGDYMAAEVLID